MATLVLSTLIKFGLVATKGATIVVPIALSKSSGAFLTSSHLSEESTRQSQDTIVSIPTEQHASSPVQVVTTGSRGIENPALKTRREEIDKKCFVVPAKSSVGNKLLTCLEGTDVPATTDENEEYGNSYYLYNPFIENKWTKVEGNLMWNPDNSQISIKLKKNTEKTAGNDGTFVAGGEKWKGISDKETDLLQECALFGNGTTSVPSYRLVCGEDTSEMSRENPKGIPLTPWQLNN